MEQLSDSVFRGIALIVKCHPELVEGSCALCYQILRQAQDDKENFPTILFHDSRLTTHDSRLTTHDSRLTTWPLSCIVYIQIEESGNVLARFV